ncbi:MAG: methyl-accepting chemotaxis protein [Candidatus Sedimenticola sp. 4PFRAG1]
MGLLKNISVVNRLVVCFILLAVVILVVGGVNYQGMARINSESEKVINSAPLIDTAMKMKMVIRSQQLMIMEMLSALDSDEVEQFMQASQEQHAWFSSLLEEIRGILAEVLAGTGRKTTNDDLDHLISEAARLHDEQLTARIEQIYQLILADAENQLHSDEKLEQLSRTFVELETEIDKTKSHLNELTAASISSATPYTQEYGGFQLLTESVDDFYRSVVRSRKVIFDYANSLSKEKQAQFLPLYENAIETVRSQLQALKSGKTADGRSLPQVGFLDIQTKAQAWSVLLESSFLPIAKEFVDAHVERMDIEHMRHAVDEEADGVAEEIIGLLGQVEKEGWDIQERALNDSREASDQATLASLAVIVGGLVLALVLGAYITLSIKHPLEKIVERLRDIAEGEGDLTQRLDVQDETELGELSRWFNEFIMAIQDMVQQIREVSELLSSAAEETSVITEKTSEGIRQQQLATDQVASAMEQMVSTVQEVARNTVAAADATRTARDETGKGLQVIMSTVGHINELAEEVDGTSDVIQMLARDSEDIGSVLDVIRGIAEQTNLLALNAAIEAARAGEQGRGFAVVADEVRTLASRTQESTSEIQEMIERLQGTARNAVTSMDTSRERASQGVNEVSQAGESLRAITTSVESISDVNEHVALAAEEQTAVAGDIQQNVGSISGIAAQTTAGANETSQASEHLAELAGKLQAMVGNFKV